MDPPSRSCRTAPAGRGRPGRRVKFPTVSHSIVAKQEVVLGLEHEMRFKASREITEDDDGQAKRVSCARGQLKGEGCGEGEGAR